MKSTNRIANRQRKRAFIWIIGFAVIFGGGCSSGYRTQWCECVPYEYCPPCPLPFAEYCGCETPLALAYRQSLRSGVVPDADQPPPALATSATESGTPIIKLPW